MSSGLSERGSKKYLHCWISCQYIYRPCRIMRMELMSLITEAQNVLVYVYVMATSTIYEQKLNQFLDCFFGCCSSLSSWFPSRNIQYKKSKDNFVLIQHHSMSLTSCCEGYEKRVIRWMTGSLLIHKNYTIDAFFVCDKHQFPITML